jgi:hypothetical protein
MTALECVIVIHHYHTHIVQNCLYADPPPPHVRYIFSSLFVVLPLLCFSPFIVIQVLLECYNKTTSKKKLNRQNKIGNEEPNI